MDPRSTLRRRPLPAAEERELVLYLGLMLAMPLFQIGLAQVLDWAGLR